MVILSLDTTTGAGSCALMRDARVVREQAGDASRPQATRLPGELAALLVREAASLHEVDALAVGVGPGSFTGLRVGIATMQGLAIATAKPLVGVSGFDALARMAAKRSISPGGSQGTRPARVATWVDAWRGEVYAALYELDGEVDAPVVARPEDLLRRLRGQAILFTGDGALVYRDIIRAALGPDAHFTDPAAPLLAGAMAELAADALRAGHRPPPHAIRPLYVRRSDAELARDRT